MPLFYLTIRITSLGAFRVTAGTAWFAATHCPRVGVHAFWFSVLQRMLGFHSPYLKKVQEMFS
jgi:hypothetical protein